MTSLADANFVDEYEPGGDAYVALKNGRIVDVVNANYFDEDVGMIIKGGKIEAMTGVDRPAVDMTPDFVVDLKGKTVLPGLINTHCHTTLTSPSILPNIRDVKHFKFHADRQAEKNMMDCLIHGVTHIRDAWTADIETWPVEK